MIDLRDYDEDIHFVLGFVTLVIIGMFAWAIMSYPDTYDFYNNFLSDLGRTVTLNGTPNPFVSNLFLVIMALGGIMMILFFLSSPNLIEKLHSSQTDNHDQLVHYGFKFGAVAGVFMAMIGVFHLDQFPVYHYAVGIIFFIFVSIAIILYSLFLIEREKDSISIRMQILSLGIALILVGVILLILVPNNLLRTIGSILFLIILLILLINGIILLFSYNPFKGRKTERKGLFGLFSGKLFKIYVDFTSLLASIYILLLIPVIVIYSLAVFEVKAVSEVVLVGSIILWVLVINMRLILLGLTTSSKPLSHVSE